MTANALIQTRIDREIKDQATTALDNMGLTVSDAVRILLTRVAKEGCLPAGLTTDPATHDAWFKAKVREALEDPRPTIPSSKVEEHFATKRAAVIKKLKEKGT